MAVRKKSVIWAWLISYISVLLLPLLISFAVYWTSSDITMHNTEKLNAIALSQTEAAIDRIFTEIFSLGRQILNRQEVASLVYAQKPLNVFKREKIGTFQENLREQVAYSNYLNGIYVYFPALELAASTEGLFESEALISELGNKFKVSTQEAAGWLKSSDSFKAHMADTAPDSTQARKIAVTMSYNAYGGEAEAICIFIVDSKEMRGLLNNYSHNYPGETQYVWVTSSQDKRIISLPEAEALAQGLNEEQDLLAALKDEDMAVSTAVSQISGWRLVSAIPMNQYTAQLASIQRTYMFFFVLCMGGAIVMSVFMSVKNYRPIKRLSSIAQDPQTNYQGKSEYDCLEDSIFSLIEKKHVYEKELDRQRDLLAQNNLVKMLRGTIYSKQAFESACCDYGFSFSTNYYSVVGLDIKDYDVSVFQKEDKAQIEDEADYLENVCLAVASLLQEILRKICDCYACQYDGGVYCIISMRSSAGEYGDFTALVKESCLAASQMLMEQLGINVTAYVSGVYCVSNHAVKGIHAAFKETRWGMEQMEGFLVSGDVMSKQDLLKITEENENTSPAYTATRWKQFNNVVVSGDITAAGELLDALLGDGIARLDPSFANIRLQAMFLLNFLICNTEHGQIDNYDNQVKSLFDSLKVARNIDELRELMQSAFNILYESRRPAEENTAPLHTEIARYINHAYSDPELSVASIANHFNFSKSYLLRVFKKGETGGILDYIHQRRVDAAKQLLRSTDNTVSDIALQVGYANSLALIRAFKRVEDITPTVYRNMAQANRNLL